MNINIDASAYVKKTELPSNLTLYPTNVASDIPTYFKMVTNVEDADYNVTAVDITTPSISGTGIEIARLATTAGVLLGNPGIINLTTLGNVRRVSGTSSATFNYEMYHRDSLGVETLIATSSNTTEVDVNIYEQFSASAVLNDGEWMATDRIVLKYYGSKVGGGSNSVFQFQFGGSVPVRTIVPVPVNVIVDLPIAIDLTSVTGGADGRILFQKAGKVGQDSNFNYDGRLILDAKLKAGDTEKTALIIRNLSNEDFRQAITVQAGLTTNQRRYFQFLNHLGVRTNLMGFNAQNGFIAYDSVNAYHFISCNSNGTSSFNSKGIFQVRINADEGATGTNGMSIYDGTANPSAANIMYNLSSAGIYLNSGRVLQAQSANNANYIKVFATNGSAYLNSVTGMKFYNSANDIQFTDSGLVSKLIFNMTNLNTAPATASSTGVKGEVRFTPNGIYICTATNTWVKATATTF